MAPNGEKKAKVVTYKMYIRKVLKEIHPDIGISNVSLEIIDRMVISVLDKLALTLSQVAKKSTISRMDMETAMRKVFPRVLSVHAHNEGCLAVEKFIRNR